MFFEMSLLNDLSIINITSWFILGLATGYMVHIIDARDIKDGLITSLLLGVLGAVVGAFVANLVFGVGLIGFDIPSLLSSVCGALLFSVTQRLLVRDQLNKEEPTSEYFETAEPLIQITHAGDIAYFSQVTPLKPRKEETKVGQSDDGVKETS